MTSLVLDAVAFDVIDTTGGAGLRYAMATALRRGGDVRCSAVTLAEVCRGTARTRRAEAALRRDRGGVRIAVTPTDESIAKLVGAILHSTGRDSRDIADAHVVAMCARADAALVVTSDPDDVLALASALPGVRIIARRPEQLSDR